MSYKEERLLDACCENNIPLVKSLIENKVNVSYQNKSGETALSLAGFFNYIEIIEILIENGVNIEDEHTKAPFTDVYFTTFTWACFFGNFDLVKLLIDKKINIEHGNRYGETGLMKACYPTSHSGAKVINLLLENGADAYSKSKNNKSAYQLANKKNKKIILDYQLKVNHEVTKALIKILFSDLINLVILFI